MTIMQPTYIFRGMFYSTCMIITVTTASADLALQKALGRLGVPQRVGRGKGTQDA